MNKLIKIAKKPGKVGKNAVSRVGGEPIGMTKSTWPLFNGKPMYHVITLGREHIAAKLPDNVAAVALFIGSLMDNSAWESATKDTKVILLSGQDLKQGTTTAKQVLGASLPDELAEEGEILAETVEYNFDEIKESTKSASEMDPEEIASSMAPFIAEQLDTRIGGHPVGGISPQQNLVGASWDELGMPAKHHVLFFFSEIVATPLNLGDMGHMHVTANDAMNEFAAWYH